MDADKETLTKLNKAWNFGISLARKAAAIVNVGSEIVGGPAGAIGQIAAGAASAVIDGDKSSNSSTPESRIKNLIDLKEKIKENVAKFIANMPSKSGGSGPDGSDSGKVVVFIDDLDRLPPVKAVELLESFKIFLDVPGCVFILACDYNVISEGLKAKFDVPTEKLKGKNFFDKIIQLPFQMPVTQYEADNYIRSLLDSVNVVYDKDLDISIYNNLIKCSIGFNPRNLKRVFNCFFLLCIVAKRKNIFTELETYKAEKNEIQRIIFAIVCLQQAYEDLYKYLSRLAKNPGRFNAKKLFELIKPESYDDKNGELNEVLSSLQNNSVDLTSNHLATFMKVFLGAIQLKEDGDPNNLSKNELITVQTLLSFSMVTSSDDSVYFDSEVRVRNRRILACLANDINNKYKSFIKKFKTDIFKPHQSRGEVVEATAYNDVEANSYFTFITFWLDGIDYSVILEGVDEEVAPRLQLHFAETLKDKYSGDFKFKKEEDCNNFTVLSGPLPIVNNNIEAAHTDYLRKIADDIFSSLSIFEP
jgi:hypothetical protein